MRDKMECPACMKWTWADVLACEWCGGSLPPMQPLIVQHQYAAEPAGVFDSTFDCAGESCTEYFEYTDPIAISARPQRADDFILSAHRDMARAARRTIEKNYLGTSG